MMSVFAEIPESSFLDFLVKNWLVNQVNQNQGLFSFTLEPFNVTYFRDSMSVLFISEGYWNSLNPHVHRSRKMTPLALLSLLISFIASFGAATRNRNTQDVPKLILIEHKLCMHFLIKIVKKRWGLVMITFIIISSLRFWFHILIIGDFNSLLDQVI